MEKWFSGMLVEMCVVPLAYQELEEGNGDEKEAAPAQTPKKRKADTPATPAAPPAPVPKTGTPR